MIDDPDDPGYRYPEPGERFWHRVWRRWVVVRWVDPEDPERAKIPGEEVPVVFEDTGQRGIVKLHSLEER